jgi:hypothetical protein
MAACRGCWTVYPGAISGVRAFLVECVDLADRSGIVYHAGNVLSYGQVDCLDPNSLLDDPGDHDVAMQNLTINGNAPLPKP